MGQYTTWPRQIQICSLQTTPFPWLQYFQTMVTRAENGRLLLRSRTLPPEPERAEDIILRPEVRKVQGTRPYSTVCDAAAQILPAYNNCGVVHPPLSKSYIWIGIASGKREGSKAPLGFAVSYWSIPIRRSGNWGSAVCVRGSFYWDWPSVYPCPIYRP